MEAARVMVVEDDEVARSFLADILQAEGYDVVAAADGRQALEAIGGAHPDLVISDVIMPEMSGIDLFRQLQADERYQNVPFIFLTCLDDGDTRFRIEELGPDDYLAKPVRPKQLLATVRGKLRRNQARQEQAERERDKLRDRIRCTLTHELRTPLTVIQGISEMLMGGSGTPGLSEYQDLLESLRSQTYRLGGLVESFLLVARIDSGEEEQSWARDAERTPIALLLADALVQWRVRAEDDGVDFRAAVPDGLPPVRVARHQVIEALRQVLDNAFKFADPASPRVAVAVAAEGANVRISVSDNGPGIPAERRAAVLAKLSQVDRDVHEQQGSGLGLYIAKRLLEINRGSIRIGSAEAGGAEVCVLLPSG